MTQNFYTMCITTRWIVRIIHVALEIHLHNNKFNELSSWFEIFENIGGIKIIRLCRMIYSSLVMIIDKIESNIYSLEYFLSARVINLSLSTNLRKEIKSYFSEWLHVLIVDVLNVCKIEQN